MKISQHLKAWATEFYTHCYILESTSCFTAVMSCFCRWVVFFRSFRSAHRKFMISSVANILAPNLQVCNLSAHLSSTIWLPGEYLGRILAFAPTCMSKKHTSLKPGLILLSSGFVTWILRRHPDSFISKCWKCHEEDLQLTKIYPTLDTHETCLHLPRKEKDRCGLCFPVASNVRRNRDNRFDNRHKHLKVYHLQSLFSYPLHLLTFAHK